MFSVPAYAFPVATVALYKGASINYVTMQVADAPETHWLQAAQRMCFSDIQVGGCCTSRYHLVLLISLEAGEGATCYLRPPVESICGPGPHNRSNIIIDICSSANSWATSMFVDQGIQGGWIECVLAQSRTCRTAGTTASSVLVLANKLKNHGLQEMVLGSTGIW